MALRPRLSPGVPPHTKVGVGANPLWSQFIVFLLIKDA